jgi:hypothetical protein
MVLPFLFNISELLARELPQLLMSISLDRIPPFFLYLAHQNTRYYIR